MSQPSKSHTASHVREHRSLTAVVEKRFMIWIATRLPAWIHSDHLSGIGLLSMLGAGLSFAAFRWTPWAATGVVACLVANWLGDSLDGNLARVRGHERPRYGYYVDHVIDIAGTTFLLSGLACSGLMNPLTAIVVLAAYLLVSAEVYLATHVSGVFRMALAGLGPTELRILIAAGALKAAFAPEVTLAYLGPIRLFDLGGAIATVGLVLAFALSAWRNTCALYAAEPLPRCVKAPPLLVRRDINRVIEVVSDLSQRE